MCFGIVGAVALMLRNLVLEEQCQVIGINPNKRQSGWDSVRDFLEINGLSEFFEGDVSCRMLLFFVSGIGCISMNRSCMRMVFHIF